MKTSRHQNEGRRKRRIVKRLQSVMRPRLISLGFENERPQEMDQHELRRTVGIERNGRQRFVQ